MPKSVWGRRCSTVGCVRPRDHQGECVTFDDEEDEECGECSELARNMAAASFAGETVEEDPAEEAAAEEAAAEEESAKEAAATSEATADSAPRQEEVRHTPLLGMVVRQMSRTDLEADSRPEADDTPKAACTPVELPSGGETASTNGGYTASSTESPPAAPAAEAPAIRHTVNVVVPQESEKQIRVDVEPSDWLEEYYKEKGRLPTSEQLIAFVKNRGGNLTYTNAQSMLKKAETMMRSRTATC